MLIVALASCVIGAGGGTVHGVVRRGDDAAALDSVTVTAAGAPAPTAQTGPGGTYVVHGIAAGRCTLQFSRPGYLPFAVTLLSDGRSDARLDVALDAAPVRMSAVRVVGRRGDGRRGAGTADLSVGGVRLGGRALAAPLRLDEPDALRALAAAPTVQIAPESPGSLHVYGGGGDENLVLLDGIPLQHATHAGAIFSAVNPAALDAVTLAGGVPSAAYGGRLSSVIEMHTMHPARGAVTRGALTTAGASALVAVPLARGRGDVLLSLRRSSAALAGSARSSENGEGGAPAGWTDLLGVVAARVGRDSVTLLGLATGDALAFGAPGAASGPSVGTAGAEGGVLQGSTDPSGAGALAQQSDGPPGSRLLWSATTAGIGWWHPVSGATAVRVAAWQSRATAGLDWASRSRRTAVSSATTATGVRAQVTTRAGGRLFRVGGSVERVAAAYDLTAAAIGGAPSCTARCALTARGAVPLAALFAEQRWSPAPRWRVRVGARAVARLGGPTDPLLEPRVAVGYRARPDLRFSVGYARAHQYVQSLWNGESPVGAIVGIDLPAAAGTSGVRVAQSDGVTASATLTRAAMRVQVDAYARRLRGLALPPAASPDPFVTAPARVGSGAGWGAGASLERELGRVTLVATGAYSDIRRDRGTSSYQPSFAPALSGSAAIAVRLAGATTLRLAGFAEGGRRATPVAGPLAWGWRRGVLGRRDLGGVPERYAGTLGSERIPPYLRVDLGVRHELGWSPAPEVRVTLFASVNNLLGRRNSFGSVAGPGGVTPLPMLPRTLSAGVQWHQ